jgi:hypothetical protein
MLAGYCDEVLVLSFTNRRMIVPPMHKRPSPNGVPVMSVPWMNMHGPFGMSVPCSTTESFASEAVPVAVSFAPPHAIEFGHPRPGMPGGIVEMHGQGLVMSSPPHSGIPSVPAHGGVSCTRTCQPSTPITFVTGPPPAELDVM